jgi:hypothetical protein
MSKQRNSQVVIILDGAARFTFPSIAKARRFVERMMRSHQVALELA